MKLIDWNLDTIGKKLDQLKAESVPYWGKMTASKMLQHLIDIVQISNGKLKVDFANKPENLPKLRHILYKEVPFPKEFAAPSQVEGFINQSKSLDFDKLKAELVKELGDFEKHYLSNEQTEKNAVFGPLNKEDWVWFHRKHISHHLAQFGLWSYD